MTKKIFDNKILLITGGTGSFGNAMVKKLLQTSIKEIRIFSRDEQKQDEMRKFFKDDKIKFYIGDIRQKSCCDNAVNGTDFIFHAAALKQVPSCEFFPLEAVKTNIVGTENILDSAIRNNVQKVICLSTDKAVYPINAMGMTKSLMEKVMISKSRESKNTIMCATRYGNVIASRGSVIPLFINQIKNNLPLTITNPNMTRFMMSLDEAIDLVFYCFENGKSGEIFIKKSPSASIDVIVKVLKDIFNKNDLKENIIGIRHGEKLYEVLIGNEEIYKAIDLKEFFKIPADSRGLDYDLYFEKGQSKNKILNEYNSNNTKKLSFSELKNQLLKNSELQKYFGKEID